MASPIDGHERSKLQELQDLIRKPGGCSPYAKSRMHRLSELRGSRSLGKCPSKRSIGTLAPDCME